MATHSSILAWRIPKDRGANGSDTTKHSTELNKAKNALLFWNSVFQGLP